MKLFKIKHPNPTWDNTVEVIVCAESEEYIKEHFTKSNSSVSLDFPNIDDYFIDFEYVNSEELIIEEVKLDTPKIICVDYWEG